MSTLAHVEINAISLVILWILHLNNHNKHQALFDNHLFEWILRFVFIATASNAVAWGVNERIGEGWRLCNLLANWVNFVTTVATTYTWALYSDRKVSESMDHMKRMAKIWAIPGGIGLFLCAASLFFPWVFFIDENNCYARGPLYIYQAVCVWIIMLGASGMALYKSRKEYSAYRKYECRQMAQFMLWPLAGSIFQSIYYGLDLIWTGTTIAILIVFLNVQARRISQDSLTGINNRGQIDRFLLTRVKDKNVTSLYLMLIDVDKFKIINDTYGHNVGDEALIDVAAILKGACSSTRYFLGRFGGDEFAVICEHGNYIEMNELMKDIRESVEEYNIKSNRPYTISLSMGYGKANSKEENPTKAIYELIKEADSAMYEEKRKKKETAGQ